MTDVVPVHQAPVSDRTREFLAASKAPATVRAYRSDLADFEYWCVARDVVSLPASPETVADYIADLAERGVRSATITRRLSALSQGHKLAGSESPTHSQL